MGLNDRVLKLADDGKTPEQIADILIDENLEEVKRIKNNKDSKRVPTRSEKNYVLDRQDNKCALCGEPLKAAATHFDHIEPHGKGGKTSVDNLQALCANCHAIKTNNDRLKDQGITDLKPPQFDLPNIRVELAFGMGRTYDGGVRKFLELKAMNYGKIPVTLNYYWLTLPNKMKLVFSGPRGVDPSDMPGFGFPYELSPGKTCPVYIGVDKINEGLLKQGYPGEVELIGCFDDTFGSTYSSDKFLFTDIMRSNQ